MAKKLFTSRKINKISKISVLDVIDASFYYLTYQAIVVGVLYFVSPYEKNDQ